ncbi:MAG: hypothetical protein Q8P73_01805 [bacterium]|nr:hypothetical protein [bacterium]
MADDIKYMSIPIESLLSRDVVEEKKYINALNSVSGPLRSIIFSARTGAYLRGVGKTYSVSPALISSLSFIVLKICFGEITLSRLSVVLSSELKLSMDKAQKMALEIERDLFAPVMMELRTVNTAKSVNTVNSAPANNKTVSGSMGLRNVLDLKKQQSPPRPPAMPK